MPFAWNSVGHPPSSDEIEVAVFGPGFGECIVVHVGGGRWFVVDSCIDPSDQEDRRPVAERYLRALKVSLEDQVDMVIATHWHDDHVMGLGRLLDQCKGAQFSCAIALGQQQFIQFVDQLSTGSSATEGAKVREFSKVLKMLRSPLRPPLKYALEARELRTWAVSQMPHGQRCVLRSFSPSDIEYQLFLQQIAAMMPRPGEPKRSAPRDCPNLSSVVLHLDFGSGAVLLGADMEVHVNPKRGWGAVMAAATAGDVTRAAVYKVAHHGSQNGFLEDAWNSLLGRGPLCVVTPFNRLSGPRKLPTAADIERMKSRGRIFLTAPNSGLRLKMREPAVLRSLRESGISTRDLAVPIGMVRFRRRVEPSADWTVELQGGATECR